MKKILVVIFLCASAFSLSFADDDDNHKADDDNNHKKSKIEYVYDLRDIGKGAVEAGIYYTGPSGTLYLFPYWGQIPIPIPVPVVCDSVSCAAAGGTCVNNICVKSPLPPTPTPVPTKANAFNSCMQCHAQTTLKYTFAQWKTTLHQKTAHKSKQCSVCHNLLR